MTYDFRTTAQPGEMAERENHPAYYRPPLRVIPENECRLHGEGNDVETCQGCIQNGERAWEMRTSWL